MIYKIINWNIFSVISVLLYNNIVIYVKRVKENIIKKSILYSLIINIIMIGIIINNISKIRLGYIENIYYIYKINIGYDNISIILVLLSIFIGIISIIGNWDNIIKYEINYNIRIWVLILLISLNFICMDLISFYILFEITLIPLYYIIIIDGSSKREKGGIYMFIYTLGSSLIMLLSIIVIYLIKKSVDYSILSKIILSLELESIIFIGLIIGLSIKTPLIPIHVWLSTVHSESPLGGSIILAGIILKLSIYGIIRLLLSNEPEITLLYIPILYVIGIITIVYSSLITLMQVDLKVIIAYSSISHLGLCILGILSNNLIGIMGSLILSIAHGLVSPALFILMGGILYDRFHNRSLLYYQGLTQYMPLFALYLLFFSFSNTGTPLSYNFIGEFLSITGAIIKNPIIGWISILSVLLSACYQMKLTNKLTSGVYSIYLNITYDLINKENFILLILTIPTLLFGIFPNLINNLLVLTSSSLIYTLIL